MNKENKIIMPGFYENYCLEPSSLPNAATKTRTFRNGNSEIPCSLPMNEVHERPRPRCAHPPT